SAVIGGIAGLAGGAAGAWVGGLVGPGIGGALAGGAAGGGVGGGTGYAGSWGYAAARGGGKDRAYGWGGLFTAMGLGAATGAVLGAVCHVAFGKVSAKVPANDASPPKPSAELSTPTVSDAPLLGDAPVSAPRLSSVKTIGGGSP